MRRLPSDVSTCAEVKAASMAARVVYAECRPSTYERVIHCADGETPAQALHALAASVSVPLTVSECEAVYREGVAVGLWRLEDGVLVLPALPPSVVEARRERRAQGRGPRGGKSPAEKMAELREKKARAAREAREASPAVGGKLLAFTGGASPLPPANDSDAVATPGGVGGSGGETLPPSDVDSEPVSPSSLLLSSREEESDAHSGAREGGGTPRTMEPPSPWAALGPLALGRAVVDALGPADAVWSAADVGDAEVAALGRTLAALPSPVTPAEVATWRAYLRTPGALNKAFAYALGVASGVEPVSVGLLLGKREGDGFRGSGIKALRNAARSWSMSQAAKNAPTQAVQALRAVPVGKLARAGDLAAVREVLKHGGEVRDA